MFGMAHGLVECLVWLRDWLNVWYGSQIGWMNGRQAAWQQDSPIDPPIHLHKNQIRSVRLRQKCVFPTDSEW